MNKLTFAAIAAAIVLAPLATPAMAKTTTQIKHEKRAADAKAKSQAKSDARKAKSAAKKKK